MWLALQKGACSAISWNIEPGVRFLCRDQKLAVWLHKPIESLDVSLVSDLTKSLYRFVR